MGDNVIEAERRCEIILRMSEPQARKLKRLAYDLPDAKPALSASDMEELCGELFEALDDADVQITK